MIRRPRRTVPATLVALVLLASAVLIAVSCVQVLLSRVPLIPFAKLAAAGARTSTDDPTVIAAAAVTGVLGLLLLVLAVKPGNPTVLPVTDGGSGIDTGISRRSLDRALAAAAQRVDGVESAEVRSGRGRVRAEVRAAFGERARLIPQVRERLTEHIAGIDPASPPRISVRVARTRST